MHQLIIEDAAAIGALLMLLRERDGYRVRWCHAAPAARRARCLALPTIPTPDWTCFSLPPRGRARKGACAPLRG